VWCAVVGWAELTNRTLAQNSQDTHNFLCWFVAHIRTAQKAKTEVQNPEPLQPGPTDQEGRGNQCRKGGPETTLRCSRVVAAGGSSTWPIPLAWARAKNLSFSPAASGVFMGFGVLVHNYTMEN